MLRRSVRGMASKSSVSSTRRSLRRPIRAHSVPGFPTPPISVKLFVKRLSQLLVILGLCSGCSGTSKDFANPVVGPPPPRIQRAQSETPDDPPGKTVLQVDGSGDATGAVVQAAPLFVSESHDEPVPLTGPPGAVAARVNGTPILVSEVLEPYRPRLEQIQEQVGEKEFAQLRLHLVARDLPQYIETAVLVDSVTATLDQEQLDSIDAQIDELFQEQLDALMQQHEAHSLDELDAALTEAGTSLENEMQATGSTLAELRYTFGRRALATQFLRESVGSVPQVTRGELLAEYYDRIGEYTQPARLQWQQTWVAYAARGGRDRARTVLQQARDELESGLPFEDVARQFSDGPMASRGGQWDWTQPESVSEPALRDALRGSSVGELSDVIEGKNAFVIAKLTGRRDVQTTPFEDVQNELRESIMQSKRNERLESVLQEIRSDAWIETMFDGASEKGQQSGSPPVRQVSTGQ